MEKEQEKKIVIDGGTLTESNFDETEFFHKEIEPRIMELGKLCQEKNIPFLNMTEYFRNDKGTEASVVENIPGARCSDRIRLMMTIIEDKKTAEKCYMALAVDDIVRDFLNAKNKGGTNHAGTDRN